MIQTIIQTPTPLLENSLKYYEALNFNIISNSNPIIVSDGLAFIEINPNKFARLGLKLYSKSWDKIVAKLPKHVPMQHINDGYLISDVSGLWIYLIEGECPVKLKPETKSTGIPGHFSGISIESIDMNKSVDLLKSLGYKEENGQVDQGWISLKRKDGSVISVMKPGMCPHMFTTPSLTYFNGDKNVEIIEKIKSLDLPITENITYFNENNDVDNIILHDPGHLGAFLFND